MHPSDVEVRECTDRNIRLIDPQIVIAARAPKAVRCEVCDITLVGIVKIIDHYQFEHPLPTGRRR